MLKTPSSRWFELVQRRAGRPLSKRRQIFGKLSKLSSIANLSRSSEVGTHLRATTPYIRIGFQRTTPASSGSSDLSRTTTAYFPAKPEETAAQTRIKPTRQQLADLAQLNEAQAKADTLSRELAALQQELYARWWKVAGKSRDFRPDLTDEVSDVREILTRVNNLKTKRDQALAELAPLPDQLSARLPKDQLELKYDAAPRFWLPADPIIVIKNCGCPTKHQFSSPLSCRLPEQIVSTAEVVVDQKKTPFNKAVGVAEIAAAAQQHLPACPQLLGKLVDEGSIVEQAIADLTQRTLPAGKKFDTVDLWQTWVDRLVKDLTWDGKRETFPKDSVSFDKPGVKPARLAALWEQQPWAPLFLDWQITWFPTPDLPATEDGFGPIWPLRQF